MNIVLFERGELGSPLNRHDARARHITEILKCSEGSCFDAGLINGNRGKAEITRIDDEHIALTFHLEETTPPLHPVDLIVGIPRPQTARDILRDATTLGVRRMVFVQTEKGEKSYASSKIWRDENYRQYLIAGAQTAFSTRIPEITLAPNLKAALDDAQADGLCVTLDNYEATIALPAILRPIKPATGASLAVGSERGWSKKERNVLRESGYTLTSLGNRVLRTETAVIAGISILLAGLGLLE